MRIAVCLSRLPDPATVEADPVDGGLDLSRAVYMLNPADGAALEMALRLRLAGDAVSALTVGPIEAEAVLREAIAVGVDEAVRLWEEGRATGRPAVTSLLLATALRAGGAPDLVLCGTRSVGSGSGKTPALLAAYLDWPVVTDILEFTVDGDRVRFQRRLARGARSEGEVILPAVLAVEAGTASLRYASLPALMMAKRATIPVRHLPDLGLSPMDLNFPTATVQATMPPYPRPRQIFIPDSGLAPDDRVAQIMSAGVAKKAGRVVEGSPEEMAESIIALLREHGFVDQSA